MGASLPGIEASTGSLGQGLSIAQGMALGLRLDKIDSMVYCVMGDGEIQEGQVWEAAMSIPMHKLDHVCAIVGSVSRTTLAFRAACRNRESSIERG